MVVRNDLIFDWFSSPRVITVQAPSTSITIQDLVDTCRFNESYIFNLQYPHLINAAGKDALGGGVFVGLTATLINAVLAFEARPGPAFIQCSVDGGNLVAIDGYGNNISPIQTTDFTQVLRTSSSSATLQELADIQYSSFGNGVCVDLLSSYSGITYPVGTPRQPVNNFADALSIANTRRFSKLYIKGDAEVDSGLDYSGKIFIGESVTKTTLIIDPAAQVAGCVFMDATITGTLDGGSTIKNCEILSLNYVSGIIESCVLHGPIYLENDAIFLDCWADNEIVPVIDFNQTTAALTMSNYNGTLFLVNKSSADSVIIELNSGFIELDSTITGGNIVIRGIGKLLDNSSNATVDKMYLLNPPNIVKSLLDEPLNLHLSSGSVGEALSQAGLTTEQAKQLLLIFINSL